MVNTEIIFSIKKFVNYIQKHLLNSIFIYTKYDINYNFLVLFNFTKINLKCILFKVIIKNNLQSYFICFKKIFFSNILNYQKRFKLFL